MIAALAVSFACIRLQCQPAAVAALEGYDPVLLTEGKEVPGKDTLKERHGRFTYQFSSEETRAKFHKDPARYEIQLEGACARMGAPVSGSPDSYTVHEGRIYIFGSSDCYKQFVKDPAKYLEPKAASNWVPSAEGAARARKALQRAVAGLSAVSSFVEVRHESSNGREREETRTARPPEAFRATTQDGQRQFGSLVDKTGGLQIFNDQGRRMPPSFAAAARSGFMHDLVTVLVARNSPTTKLDLEDKGSVKVLVDGVENVLHLDPETGRVASMTYQGRVPGGAWGVIRITYSDYKDAGGAQLPYRAEMTVEGQSTDSRSWIVQRYVLNPPDIEARLAPPAKVQEN